MPKISKAVQDALDKQDINTKLDALNKLVVTGFAGVHERQDTTNGKVLKAGADINDLRTENQKLSAKFEYNRIIWYLFTVALSIIILLASYIIFHKLPIT